MKLSRGQFRPLFKSHGGKYYLARAISSVLETIPHNSFSELFGSGASVMANKRAVPFEHYNELDPKKFAAMWLLKTWPHELISALDAVPYTRERFDEAVLADDAWIPSLLPIDKSVDSVVNWIVRNRFSRGGLGQTFAWSERLRGGQPEQINSWATIRQGLPALAERMRSWLMTDTCAGVWLKLQRDNRDRLFYLDPPYQQSTRTVKRAYGQFELADDDADAKKRGVLSQEYLLDLACDCKGPVAISGYHSALYDQKLKGWKLHEFDIANNSGQGKTKQMRVECLWVKQ